MIGVQGYSQLHNEFEASLGYTRRLVSKTWPVSGVHARTPDLSRSFDLSCLPSLLYLLGVKCLQNRTLLISAYSFCSAYFILWRNKILPLLQRIWHKYLSFSFYQHTLNTYRIVFIVIPPHMHIVYFDHTHVHNHQPLWPHSHRSPSSSQLIALLCSCLSLWWTRV